jgi:hypothetical protein
MERMESVKGEKYLEPSENVSSPWPCLLFFSKAPSYLKEEIKVAREVEGRVFKWREIP